MALRRTADAGSSQRALPGAPGVDLPEDVLGCDVDAFVLRVRQKLAQLTRETVLLSLHVGANAGVDRPIRRLVRRLAKDAPPDNEHFAGENTGYVFIREHERIIFKMFVVALE